MGKRISYILQNLIRAEIKVKTNDIVLIILIKCNLLTKIPLKG